MSNGSRIVGENIRKAAKQAGKSHLALSKEMGVSYMTFYRWVDGRAMMDYDKLIKLAKCLGVKVGYLFGEE